jgi:small nuclear ribonucleoprotein (snRNP)-like protein
MEDVLREGQVMEGVFQAFQSYKNIVLKAYKNITLNWSSCVWKDYARF